MAFDNRWWRQTGFRELRQILYWTWDPIGVNDAFPRTESEYDDCAFQVARRLAHGADAEEIARYLSDAGRDFFGMDDSEPATSTVDTVAVSVARRLVEWYPQSRSYWEDLRGRPAER